MDEGRFDSLTRRLAAVSTRRAPVRGLAGAALTAAIVRLGVPESVASKKGKKKKGKKKGKKGKDQCSAVTKPCTESAQCCGSLICFGSESRCCAPITTACSSHEHCCVGFCETDDEGVPRCCLPEATPCTLPRECCSGVCSGNICVLPDPGPTCLEHGEVCEGSDECCGELICSGSVNECCAPLNGGCSSNEECCVGVCQTDNDGEPRCCRLEGASCNLARECCSGVCLPNNTCAPSGPNCLVNGAACEDSEECCSAHCDEVGEDGCCVPIDGACINDGDCCQHPDLDPTSIVCQFYNGANRCCGVAGTPCGPSAEFPTITCCPGSDCGCLGFVCLCG